MAEARSAKNAIFVPVFNACIMSLFVITGVVGPWQVVLLIVLALVLFGGKKIPELMKGLGQGMKEFKKATREDPEEEKKEQDKLPR